MAWTCATCGSEHEGLPLDFGFDAPAHWDGPRHDDDFLGSDLCSWTDDDGVRCYFIRGVLEIPVPELNDRFAYGVWGSLSAESYARVLELWDDPAAVEEPPYFSWLSNSIRGYPETLNLRANVITAPLGVRPSIVLLDDDHPLAVEQREGISVARVQEIAGLLMHD